MVDQILNYTCGLDVPITTVASGVRSGSLGLQCVYDWINKSVGDFKLDVVLLEGKCREHAAGFDFKFRREEDLATIHSAIRDGSLHLAKEASVAVIAIYMHLNQSWSAALVKWRMLRIISTYYKHLWMHASQSRSERAGCYSESLVMAVACGAKR